jgi:hypothetical protein
MFIFDWNTLMTTPPPRRLGARICKRLWSPGIDSARLGWESIPGLFKGSTNSGSGQLAYTSVIRILSTSLTKVSSIFFICWCSRVITLCLAPLYCTFTYLKPSQRSSTLRRYFLSFPALSTIDCFICWKRLEKVGWQKLSVNVRDSY